MTVDPLILQLVDQHLYPRQREVWKLVTIHDMSFRAIAIRLDLNRTGVSDAYDAACRRLRKHGVRFTPDGRPYLEETSAA